MNEIDYTKMYLTIGEIKARIAYLIERGAIEEPEADEDDSEVWKEHEELKNLQEVEHDLNWCWESEERTLIHTDKFDDYTKDFCIDIGMIQEGCFLIDLIDWDKAADNLRQAYKSVSLPDNNDYWVQG